MTRIAVVVALLASTFARGASAHGVEYSVETTIEPFPGGAPGSVLISQGETRVLCTGAVYTIQRFCEALGKPFPIRAYTEAELSNTLGDMLPRLIGCHYHDVIDPAWFGLWDFKVMLLRKPGGTPQPAFKNSHGYRWYSQK